MPKTQVIYNNVALFAGGAPSSGYHFITSEGTLNNSWSSIANNYPLVFPIKRVIGTSYSLEVNRTNISNLGSLGTIARPILNSVDVSLNFDYYLIGLINELRLGLLVNVNMDGGLTENFIYGTGRGSLLSGLFSRDLSPTEDSIFHYPLQTREPANIFIAVKKDALDYNDTITGTTLENSFRNTDVNVYGFGDCYLNSYRCSAGVNQLPTVSVGFAANNLEVYEDGLGNDIPAINPKTYNIYSGTKFSIPNNFEGDNLPTVLLPSDITLSIKQRSDNSENLTDLFLDYNDVKIQDFSFDINLNRTPLYGMGYKYPLDRVLVAPIISNLNFSFLPGDDKASSLTSLIKRDEFYDINIKLKYQRNTITFSGTAINYDFLGAKFNGFNANISLGQRQNNSFSFTTELYPNRIDQGIFMSGYLGIPNSSFTGINYLVDEFDYGGDDFLLFQNGDFFVLSSGIGYKLLY